MGKGGPPGTWWGRVTCADGSRPWIKLGDWPNSAQGRERARAEAAAWTERLREQSLGANPPGGAPLGDSFAEYVKRWLEDRGRRGLSSVSTDRGRLALHVVPRLEAKRITEIGRDDARAVVEHLDELARSKTISWRTAVKVWGLVTKLFGDACESKTATLRVRTESAEAGSDRDDVTYPPRAFEKTNH